MLDDLFMTILDMSKVASVAILVVLAVRLLLKGAPKVFSYALWAVVLFRLLCPFSIGQTTLSLVPEITPTAETYELNDEPISMADAGSAAYKAIGDALNGGLGVQRIHTTDVEADGSFRVVTADWYDVWILAGQYVWLAVLLVLLLRSGISYRKVKRSIGVSIPLRDNIFLADDLGSPFVVGLFRPKIYLPSNLTEEEQSYIILHEQHHIRRGDHIFKVLAFIALCLHWFNPLVWVAFILAGKDMEMSCDEAVIRKVGSHVRADYSASLLTLATGRRIIAGTPLAFGEGDTKGRIHNLAKWKKPARWIVILSVVLCLILAVCLLTNPAKGMPLYEIDGRNSYSDSLDTRESIEIISNGKEASVTDQEGFLKALDEIKVSRKAIDQSRSEDRDSSHQIILDGQYEINFSWSCSTVWIDNHVKPSYTYVVANPAYVRQIFNTYFGNDAEASGLVSTNGFAQWEFAPAVSSRLPVFRVAFDMEYSTISANCDAGMLVNWDSPEKSSDMDLVLTDGSALYWSPMDKDGNVVSSATISFTVVRDNKTTYLGNLHIESSGDRDFDGRWIYNAFLSRTGMYLSPNLDNEGAVISEMASMTTNEQIKIWDLSLGALEIPIEELDEYAFRTNSTKISVTVLSEQVFSGNIALTDISQNNLEIMQSDVEGKTDKCIFTNLTQARLYRIETTGLEGSTVIIR